MSLYQPQLTFHRFLMSYRRDGPVGDLVNDFRNDPQAPRTDKELLGYLRLQAGFSDRVNTVIGQAWAAYLRARKKVGQG